MRWSLRFAASLAAFGAALATSAAAELEHVKIGLVKVASPAAIYIAKDKGYFAAHGLDAEIVAFDAAQPIAVAAVAGDIEFGVTGLSAGFYSLAGASGLRIITAGTHEVPGFDFVAFVASRHASDAGLKSFKDLAGRSVAVTQIGSPVHYSLALIAEKYGLDLKSMRVLPLQSNANEVTAIIGNQADAAVIPSTFILPAVDRGEAKLLGFGGAETPWQTAAAFTTAKLGDTRRDTVERFLASYREGVRDYHDAFVDERGQRRDGPGAPEVAAILSKYVGLSAAQMRTAVTYVDRDARLDVADILHQIAWYKSQGMLKAAIDGDAVIDKRFVVPLP